MVWGTIAAAYGAVLAHAEAKAKGKYERIGYDDPPILLYYPEPKRKISDKCQSCHSREFREHNGRRVCSYCRSEG